MVTIREIKRYFEMYSSALREFKTTNHGLGPRAFVGKHIKTVAIPTGREVWREPQPARTWHLIQESLMKDDWKLLTRMTPDYQGPPPAPTPPPHGTTNPEALMPEGQVAARILHGTNTRLMDEWNKLRVRDGISTPWPSVIEFALANETWQPGQEFRPPLNEEQTLAIRRRYTEQER